MSVINEFKTFLEISYGNEKQSHEVRIANILLEHINEVIVKKSAYGSRSAFIAEILKNRWSTSANTLQLIRKSSPEKDIDLVRIKSIEVGPFRGFKSKEQIDIDSNHVLIYGPNGTGKTSFCEALEFGLLGSVSEADRKRFKNQEDYLKNAHVNEFKKPLILGIYGEEEKEIKVNDEIFRYCFIEKNRIDNFSLMAAHSPAKQTEIIATLFGLDEFNDFVNNFSNTLDEKYIDLVGVKKQELERKREELTVQNVLIENSQKVIDEKQKQLDAILTKFKLDSLENLTKQLNSKVSEINGKVLETSKLTPLKEIQSLVEKIDKKHGELNVKKANVAKISDQISYKNLYESVISIQSDIDECPTCLTPLNKTKENPWVFAKLQLEKLKEAAKLEEEFKLEKVTLIQCLESFNNVLKEYDLDEFIFKDSEQNNLISWWEVMASERDEIKIPALNNILKQLDDKYKSRTQDDLTDNEPLLQEKNAIEAVLNQIEKNKTIIESKEGEIVLAKKAIADFDENNSDLISQVSKEEVIVKTNLEIVKSYEKFVEKLKKYKDNLPSQLIEDLGDGVIRLYNLFNRNDGEHELLHSIDLPLKAGDQINIYFKDNKTQARDALHVLSEGHVRCIGLSILLAKNLKEKSPLVIFDDPVNAIDDDHRESIRKSLFEEGLFDEKQIILACHGEEFYKDVQNLLGPSVVKNAKCITFLPRQADNHIRIESNDSPRCYLLLASACIEKLKKRDALSNSRRALELLAKGKLWKYVNRFGDGNLSIKMRAANSEIELRNLCEQLKCKINAKDFSDHNKKVILDPLSIILGPNGNSREWRYLNKGTHEELDRAEFDLGTVRELIDSMIEIDEELRKLKIK